MKQDDFLKSFGIALMNSVRDPAIVASRMILNGNCKADEDRVYLQFVDSLSVEAKQLLEQMITKTVDLTIFHFLTFFEAQEDFFLAAKTEDELVDLNELSDGLGGELWGDDGWIEQFSDPESYLDDNE